MGSSTEHAFPAEDSEIKVNPNTKLYAETRLTLSNALSKNGYRVRPVVCKLWVFSHEGVSGGDQGGVRWGPSDSGGDMTH